MQVADSAWLTGWAALERSHLEVSAGGLGAGDEVAVSAACESPVGNVRTHAAPVATQVASSVTVPATQRVVPQGS